MVGSTSSRSVRLIALLGLLLLVAALPLGSRSLQRAAAQETIECPPASAPAPAAASPAASPEASPVAEAPVEFPEEGGTLTVFAAASLTDVFDQMATDLTAENPNLAFEFNYAGSSALATQLLEGAPADVFASANNTQMTNAVEGGVIDGEPETFTRNRLVLVVPSDNPAGIESVADLANDGVSLVLAAPEVPVGQYARESACKAAADTATYGDDFLTGFAANIVSNEENVRAVLAKIELGEADAGIVYTSDVSGDAGGDVVQIEIPDPVNVVATYPIAPVADGDTALAEAFIAYVLSADGQATLQEYGFQPLS